VWFNFQFLTVSVPQEYVNST